MRFGPFSRRRRTFGVHLGSSSRTGLLRVRVCMLHACVHCYNIIKNHAIVPSFCIVSGTTSEPHSTKPFEVAEEIGGDEHVVVAPRFGALNLHGHGFRLARLRWYVRLRHRVLH